MHDNKQVPDDITSTDSIVPTDELICFGESASSMNKADNPNLENGKIYLIQSLVIWKIPYTIIVHQKTLFLFCFIGVTNQGLTKDIEDAIIACKDGNTCSECPNTGPVASNGIKRRRYR